jgi:feruloyl esterase
MLASTSAYAKASPEAPLACDDSIIRHFHPDAQTTVLRVKAFPKGSPLLLSGVPDAKTPRAAADLCMVKLVVGPGNPGPVGAPSTSSGIGIEVWMPMAANWNERIHVLGGGGWAGDKQGSVTELALESAGAAGSPADVAGVEGAVSATTDTGHSYTVPGTGNAAGGNGSFGMLPDGRINTVLWHDFAERGIHEMAVKTKALTKAFYGRPARHAYWDGFSTGGRQGLKEAQANPRDFDGILAGAPAINWTRFITGELNMQIAMYRDVGRLLTSTQLATVSNAAITACDRVGGVHLGYILDPAQCRYDPTKDRQVLCASAGGAGPAGGCVTAVEARTFNKMWYGLTTDGTAPDPAGDNGFGAATAAGQRWFAQTRGTDLRALAGATPFAVSTDLIAMELGDPTLATPAFVNAKGDGANGYKGLGYADLNRAFDRGLADQAIFSDINTDNTDLTAFRDGGGKLLMYHGLSDVLIPSQGSINYYDRVSSRMGGATHVQTFYRLYLVPGMSHAFANGTANKAAIVPLPDHDRLYTMLTQWVEHGQAPGRYDITAKDAPGRSGALCVYPQKPTFSGGDPTSAASYTCS